MKNEIMEILKSKLFDPKSRELVTKEIIDLIKSKLEEFSKSLEVEQS